MKLSFKDWWDSLTGVRGKIRDEDEGDAYFIALAAWNAALAQQAQPEMPTPPACPNCTWEKIEWIPRCPNCGIAGPAAFRDSQ